jgi:trk system potassium uptake protein TrkH
MKAVLANLGFVLQTAGLFLIIPILTAFYYNEIQPLISFFLTSFVFLATGFLLNAVAERKVLDFKGSSLLLVSVFFLLGLVGSLPYLYLRIFESADPVQEFSNSYFESISGYTTTGLSVITNIDSLPKSLILYRSLTEWIGGFGLIFILLVFFFPETARQDLAETLGLPKFLNNLKRTFLSIILVYTLYAVIFTGLLFLTGVHDIVLSLSTVFSALMTGGMAPTNNLSTLLEFPRNLIITVAMLLGATSFAVHYKLIGKRERIPFSHEFYVLLTVIFLAAVVLNRFANLDLATALFHTTSASSTTGFSFINFQTLSVPLRALILMLMFIGGSTFSTAGGIKILRLFILLKSIPWAIRTRLGEHSALQIEGTYLSSNEVIIHFIVIILSFVAIFLTALYISFQGFDFLDSMFEVTSAFSTTGFSSGITTPHLSYTIKWPLVLLMILGRVEIMPFLVALIPVKARKHIERSV